MNLNEYLVSKKKPKGIKQATKNSNSNAVYGVNKVLMGPPATPPLRKKSSPSSDLNWGRSHISVPNTVSSSARKSRSSSKVSSEEPESKIIVALTEGRGGARCEVGIAAVDVARPLIVLCQISDTQSYVNTLTKINIINPNEILVPTTFVDHFTESRLVTMIRKQFPRIKITGIPRSSFSKINGLETLSGLCVPSLNGILLVLQHRYYAVAAASALITHIQENLFIYYAKGTIKIEYQESEGYAIIDTSTADRLELVCSTKPAQANKYSSLFGVLNHCCTHIGMRTLRSSILRPPCRVEYIEERLECVTELLNNPEARVSIQALLQSIPNIDILLGIATILPTDPQKCSNRQLNYVLLLNGLLDLVAPLKDVLSKFKMPFFVQLRQTLDDEAIIHIKNSIRKMLNEDAHPAKGSQATMQRCFAIKCGVNGLLDLVRKTYSERLNDLQEYTKQLSEKYGLALTLHNNQTKGYHLALTLKGAQKRTLKKSDLPDEFIEVRTTY
nr:unnamed protein product [Callosobruchus analis]